MNMISRDIRRTASGYRNARVREAQMLPLGWRHLTEVDIRQLQATVSDLSSGCSDLPTLEACLLLWSSLVLGRHPEELLPLTLRMLRPEERLAKGTYGLVGRRGRWGWWLPAAAPPGQRNAGDVMHQTAPGLYLPATKFVRALLDQCVDHRRRQSTGRFMESLVPQPLFTGGRELLDRVTSILASRHPLGPHRARKATTTPESVARWLPAELIGAAGGDIVPAGITTGRISKQAETPSYYGAARHDRLVTSYAAAIKKIDKVTHGHIPGEVVTAHLGDRLTPTDAAVSLLVDRLAASLNDRQHDLGEQHDAMTRYTVGLLSFALAHRGDTGTMPALHAVDRETRFAWIDDKVAGGCETRRLVWICDSALAQLELYAAHVDRVRANVSLPAAAAIEEILQGKRLPLFDMTSGAVRPLSVVEATRMVFRPAGLPKNAGRHWLRARLVGKCSSESLHALFGHGMIGDGVWDASSTLDPAVYRADLARVLDPALRGIGWTPRSTGAAS